MLNRFGKRVMAGGRALGVAAVLTAVVGGGATMVGSSSAGAASTPVTIGFLGGPGGTLLVGVDPTVKAAESYINKTLHGVNGHPLKVVVCDDEGTPESVTNCADEFVSDHVSAVGSVTVTNESELVTPLAAAGIPILLVNSVGAGLTSPDVFSMGIGVFSALLLPAVYGHQHALSSSAMLLINSSSSQQAIDLMKPFYTKEGVAFSDQLVDPSTPTLISSVEAAAATHPASLAVEGGNSFCEAGLKAKAAAGYTGQVFLASCASPELARVVGATTMNGVVAISDGNKLANTKQDDATYVAAMKKYAKGTPPWGDATVSTDLARVFGNVSLLATVLRTKVPASAHYAPSAVLSALTGLNNFKYFLDDGMPITGNHQLVKITPAVGTTKAFAVKFDGTKEVSDGYLTFASVLNG